eukprot:jgi/Galph1/2134/GphlegSOOS_G806.1
MGRRSEKIKGRKEAQDKVRTKWFSLIGKKIVAAVRKNGQDVTTNKDLQDALELAKKHNYPKENIQRSISRALNSKEVDLKRMVFELYGVGGVGILVNVCTDNVNRISSDIRAIANKHGIKLAEPGSLSFKFSLKGQIILDNVSGTNEEALLLDVAEAGAEDCIADFEEIDDNKAAIYRVICDPKNLEMVASFLESNHYPCRQRERVFLPLDSIECDRNNYIMNQKIIESLECIDDVEHVFTDMKLFGDEYDSTEV